MDLKVLFFNMINLLLQSSQRQVENLSEKESIKYVNEVLPNFLIYLNSDINCFYILCSQVMELRL